MDPSSGSIADLPHRVIRVKGMEDVGQLSFDGLSEYFDPFLHHFIREALQGRGQVWVSKDGSKVDGLLLYNFVERVGSIFTRDQAVAQRLFGIPNPLAIFSDYPLAARTEAYHVYEARLPRSSAPHRFVHPTRAARPSDRPALVRMMQEMYGRIDTRWLQSNPSPEEKCLVVEVDGQLAGAGWVSVVNGHGRLHSLSVRPKYRRMKIGTDLWHARTLWAERAGASEVISEISEQNVASIAIATAAGMGRVGQILLSYRSAVETTPPSA